MTNKILALKYRPQEFKDLIGQEVMVQTITNAIKLGKTPNAYLLTGIRGVGKTTCARIFANTVNNNENAEYNIFELDAASNNGVDHIRNLIEQVKIPPQIGKYKIYISFKSINRFILGATSKYSRRINTKPYTTMGLECE